MKKTLLIMVLILIIYVPYAHASPWGTALRPMPEESFDVSSGFDPQIHHSSWPKPKIWVLDQVGYHNWVVEKYYRYPYTDIYGISKGASTTPGRAEPGISYGGDYLSETVTGPHIRIFDAMTRKIVWEDFAGNSIKGVWANTSNTLYFTRIKPETATELVQAQISVEFELGKSIEVYFSGDPRPPYTSEGIYMLNIDDYLSGKVEGPTLIVDAPYIPHSIHPSDTIMFLKRLAGEKQEFNPYAGGEEVGVYIYDMELDTISLLDINGQTDIVAADWAHDGWHFAYSTFDGDLFMADFLQEQYEVFLASPGFLQSLAFAPEGRYIFYTAIEMEKGKYTLDPVNYYPSIKFLDLEEGVIMSFGDGTIPKKDINFQFMTPTLSYTTINFVL